MAAPDRLFLLMLGVFLGGGMLNAVETLLVPRFKLMLGLGYAQALTIQLAYYASYLLLAWPVTVIVARAGSMRAIAIGAATIAAGSLALAASLTARAFAPLLAALLATSTGVTILQIACNGMMATTGSRDRAASRFTALQGFNSLGTVLGPLAGAGALLGSAGGAAPQLPFVAFAAGFLTLAMAFRRGVGAISSERAVVPHAAQLFTLLRTRAMSGGVAAIFAYVGAEVTIGTLAPSYLMLHDRGGWTPAGAGRLVSLYWSGAMIGRFAGAWMLRRAAPRALLSVAALAAMALTLLAALPTGRVGAAALLAVGLTNSIMFPTVFALAMPSDARDVPAASMLLCMAVVGGAIVPLTTGLIADRTGLATALLLPSLCYAAVLAFTHMIRTRA